MSKKGEAGGCRFDIGVGDIGGVDPVCGVAFISSGHNPEHTKSVNRKKADGSVINVQCPVCIVDYNHFMGGVDKGDQYRKYYHVRVKSRKSYKYFFALFAKFVYSIHLLLVTLQIVLIMQLIYSIGKN